MNNSPTQSNQKYPIKGQSSFQQSQVSTQKNIPKKVDQSLVVTTKKVIEDDLEKSNGSFIKNKPQIQIMNTTTSNALQNDMNKSSNVIYQALNNIKTQYKQSEKIIDELKLSLIHLENCSSSSLDLFLNNLFGILQSNNNDQTNILPVYESKNHSVFPKK